MLSLSVSRSITSQAECSFDVKVPRNNGNTRQQSQKESFVQYRIHFHALDVHCSTLCYTNCPLVVTLSALEVYLKAELEPA